MKEFIKDLVVFIIIVLFLIIIFTPSEKDKKAYKKCIETYDKKTCQKLIYGNY